MQHLKLLSSKIFLGLYITGTAIATIAGFQLLASNDVTRSGAAFGSVSRMIEQDEQNFIVMCRPAGLNADRSQISTLSAVLDPKKTNKDGEPFHPAVKKAALLALAQIGAMEALPMINATIENDQKISPDVVNFATVAEARIIAENNAKGISDMTTKAATKIDVFFRQIKLSPDQINAVMSNYHQQTLMHMNHYPPLEVYAARQIADMAYQSGTREYAQLPQVMQIRFSLDPAAELKMKLAPLSKMDRAKALVQDLSQKKIHGNLEACELQLAADEGFIAGSIAAIQLKKMEMEPNQHSHEAFNMVLGVLSCSGDKSQMTLAEHLTHNSDSVIASYAKASYRAIQNKHRSGGLFVMDY